MLLSKVEDAQIKLLLLRDDVLSNIESEGKTSTGSGSEAVDESRCPETREEVIAVLT